VSHVHRLRTCDRIFFITVNLQRALPPLGAGEYPLVAAALEASRRKLHFLLHGYVLLPDHWHGLIWTAHPLTISRVVQDIKWTSATALNRSRHTTGTVWQHQFWDRFVRHARGLRQRLDYMHWNPVRKGLVKKPEEWPWSSYNNFAIDARVVALCPVEIDYVRLPEGYRA
jgi:REP-associated tyrosine transposase